MPITINVEFESHSDWEILYISKEDFRIRMIFVFLSSELYIKGKHSNGVKFSNGDCYLIWCHK
jgi:hypothetical protein